MRPAPLRPAAPCAAAFLLALGATAQGGPPPAVEWWLAEARATALADQPPWWKVFDRSTLSVGRYRLAAGAEDGQRPHDRDEVYHVVAGRARFTAAGETRELAPGDLVFVAAHAEHRFHDITADLDVLVLFSAAVPATGGMRAGPRPTEQTPYPENSPRGATRIFYWYGPGSAGQVAIGYGRPRWQQGYEDFLTRPSARRWRLGENFWTTLDTNMRLTLAGVDVPIGLYYLVLQNDAERGLELVLLDPQQVRRQRLDAYQAANTTGGMRVPLERAEARPATASRLAIELTVDRSEKDRGALEVAFGRHRLRAALQMHPHRE